MRLGWGSGSAYTGDADFILTDLYGPLPQSLRGKPGIVNVMGARVSRLGLWTGADPIPIGNWGRRVSNEMYAINVEPRDVAIGDMVEDEFKPGRGWFPLALPLRLLADYTTPGMTVWDGFMGRGTVGAACQALRLNFVGIDINEERVEMAREYLGC